MGCSDDIDEHTVVVRGYSPVLVVVIFVWIVLLVVGEECIELEALSEVLGGFHAADVVQHVEVAVSVHAATDQSVPVDALQLQVGVVLLELEVHEESKVDVWTLDGVLVLTCHLELVEVEHFREHLHFVFSTVKILY